MRPRGRSVDEPSPELSLRTQTAEDAFRSAFHRLRPNADAPSFEVTFRPYAGLRSKVRYDRESKRIRASLSDLLRGAPAEVLEALATTLLWKLYGERVPSAARELYRRWVNTPAVQEDMLRARRSRGRKHLLPARGSVHDLSALFDQLNSRHFGAALRKPALGWTQHVARQQMGHYDPAHDAIAINRGLDAPGVPRLAVEFVLFHEMLHIKHPVQFRGSGRCVHTPEFIEEERRFPGYRQAKRMLRSLQLAL